MSKGFYAKLGMQIYPVKPSRPIMLLTCSVLSCGLTLSLFHILNGVSLINPRKGRTEMTHNFMSLSALERTEKEMPFCVQKLLDKRFYDFKTWATKSENSSYLVSHKRYRHSCRLKKYSEKETVACFDAMYQEKASQNRPSFFSQTKELTKLHFVFIGDSRIRQQFFNFLQLIPDYDRKAIPTQIKKNEQFFKHGDVKVESSLLKLRVSYKWQPTINEDVNEIIRKWIINDQTERPTLILLSMEVHHMLTKNAQNIQLYQKKLIEFVAVLGSLANFSDVIWLNQYPTVEFFGPTFGHNTDIHSEKVNHYNEAVRSIFKNYSVIRIWDSSNPLAEEYIRGCSIFPEREMHHPFFENDDEPFMPISCKPYISCLDFIHTGYVALLQATQLLYNKICNIYQDNISYDE